MKKFNYITLSLLGLTTLATSCSNDFLDERPASSLPLETAITNELNLGTAVYGIYNMMQTTGNLSLNGATVVQSSYGGMIPTLNELLSDNSFVGLSNSNRFATTRQKDLSFYVPTLGDNATLWNSLYRIIANANLVIAKDGQIADDSNTSIKPQNYFAEAYAARAMAYMQLASFYCNNYGEGNQEYGLPIVKTFDVSTRQKRSTVKEVYDFILEDLKKAESNIASIDNKRMGTTAVQMLMARYYLSVKDYNKAAQYAQLVIDSGETLSKDKVADLFTVPGENSDEIIFQLDNNSKDLPGSNDGLLATWSSVGTYKHNFATRAFYDKLGDNDVRKGVDLPTQQTRPGTWYIDNSFVRSKGDNPKPIDVMKYRSFERDIIVFRRSEAWFILFESLYHTAPSSALTQLVDWVKEYRDTDYSFTGTGEALLKEILFQKDAELFLEGTRRSDMKRNNFGYTNPQTGVVLAPTQHQFRFFPIPQSEMNNNPNMVQNPGY